MSGRLGPGELFVGIFLCLFGAVFVFLGSGGALMVFGEWLPDEQGYARLSTTILLLALSALPIGLLCLWGGVTMLRGDARRDGGDEE
jgi:hypothetical protein